MYANDAAVPMQITFHYLNGESDSFVIYPSAEDEASTPQDIRQNIRHFLKEGWWVIHLADETVLIQASNVLKVEIKPSLSSFSGEGVLGQGERVTALTRGR